jgi:hypothetical membrane protein
MLVLAGVGIYAVIDTALLFLRPQFSLLHNAESDYGSRGSWGWLMDVNFVLRGLLSLAAVKALLDLRDRRARIRIGLALVTVWALVSALLGFFPDDPVGTRTHRTGAIHVALAFVAFVAVLVGAVLVSSALRARPAFAATSRPLLVLSVGALVPLLLLAHAHLARHSLGGLFEKAFLGMELLWLVVASAAASTASRSQAQGDGS